jgi:hypothetical protein
MIACGNDYEPSVGTETSEQDTHSVVSQRGRIGVPLEGRGVVTVVCNDDGSA